MQYSANQIWKGTPSTLNIFFFLLWILSMMAVPISIWVFNYASTSNTMIWGVITQSLLLIFLLLRSVGVWSTAKILLAITFMGWAAEFIGTQTGLPFGVYHYTENLQPQIGHVPLLIPIAWFMMLPVSWGLAQQLFHTLNFSANTASTISPFRQRIIIAMLSAVYMTAWDLFLDPQMVAWGFWVWESPGQINYFGIPLLNYAGWLLVSFTMTWVINPPDIRGIYPQLWLMYAIVWFLETFGLLLFWGLGGPAIVGGIVMGGLLFLPVIVQFNENRRTNIQFRFNQLQR